jgi:c(7)-type cytochrome triheme protein
MMKIIFIASGITLLAGSFLLVSNAAATDDYDVKAFGPKSPIVWTKPAKTSFEHRPHTDVAGLECKACHGEIFAMQRGVAQKTGKFTMASLADGMFCGACHDGKRAFASDTKCAACHKIPDDPIVWTKPVKAVVFFHETHGEKSDLKCVSCHDGTFPMQVGVAEKSSNFTMKSIYEGRYCGACHDGDTAFAANTRCNTCHIGRKGYDRLMGRDPYAEKDGH